MSTVRLACVIGVLTAAQVGVLLMFASKGAQRQREANEDEVRDRATRMAAVLAAAVVPQMITNDMTALPELVATVSHEPWFRGASITNDRGLILADSNAPRMGKYFEDADARDALAGRREPAIVYDRGTTFTATAPVLVGDDVLGWVWVTARADRAEPPLALWPFAAPYVVGTVLLGLGAFLLLVRKPRSQRAPVLPDTEIPHDKTPGVIARSAR